MLGNLVIPGNQVKPTGSLQTCAWQNMRKKGLELLRDAVDVITLIQAKLFTVI